MARSRRTLFIDIDKGYDMFMELAEPVYKQYISWLSQKLGLCIESVNFKKSSSGNVHAIVNLCRDIEDPEEYVYLHILFGCDIILASLAMYRYKMYGDPIIRMYEIKKIVDRKNANHS